MNKNIIKSKENLDAYLNIIDVLKYREIPYIPEKEIFSFDIYNFNIPKEYSFIFSVILKLIPLYYEVSEDYNVFFYAIKIPTHDYFNKIIEFLSYYQGYLWGLKEGK